MKKPHKNDCTIRFLGREAVAEHELPVEAFAAPLQDKSDKSICPAGINRSEKSTRTATDLQTEVKSLTKSGENAHPDDLNENWADLAQHIGHETPQSANPDAATLCDVSLDIAGAKTNGDLPNTAATPACENNGDTEAWSAQQFETYIREAFPEPIKAQSAARAVEGSVPFHCKKSDQWAGLKTVPGKQVEADEAENKLRRRGSDRKKRVAKALRAIVESDSRYRCGSETVDRMNHLFDKAFKGRDQHKIKLAHDALIDSISVQEDFHLTHLASIANRIERCGRYGAFACGSYWCSNCKNRFGARLTEDTQVRLRNRYGDDLEKARANLLHVTILSDLVIPDPDIDRDYLADFAASTIRRDHLEISGHLARLQADRRSAMSALLHKLGLSLELAEDWIGLLERDRRFYDQENLTDDASRLIDWNEIIDQARNRFRPRSQRKRSDLESSALISCRDEDHVEAYLWQLRNGERLDREDIVALAQGFQFIYREFPGITKTNYPERLKFKSSIEKVIKRERAKLYRLPKDLPGVSVIGTFELELVDLRHAIGGNHQHRTKAKTLRILASQERKPTKYRQKKGPISIETQRRREKNECKKRLLDQARERITVNGELLETDFPGLRYAVLLHMHVLTDLNGTSRTDLERWLTGKGISKRRFNGQWKLPYQVMVKSLFENKPVDDSLRHISFYPIKGPLTFNYANTALKPDEDVPEGDAASFSDEALALIVWLQHGIGNESLRVAIDWPGVNREKRGRKPTRTATPNMTEDELVAALAERGVIMPTEPTGETDIDFLFEQYAATSQGSPPPEEASIASNQERENQRINDTASSPTTREGGIRL